MKTRTEQGRPETEATNFIASNKLIVLSSKNKTKKNRLMAALYYCTFLYIQVAKANDICSIYDPFVYT